MSRCPSFVRSTVLLGDMCLAHAAQAQSLVLPNTTEAIEAIVDMLSGSNMSRPSKVKLGTCIAALETAHPRQVACTVSVAMRAATSENQMGFYKQDKVWKVQPRVSQDKLSFPDPQLR